MLHFIVAALVFLLGGCAGGLQGAGESLRFPSDTWRYTWQRTDLAILQTDWAECVRDSHSVYSPQIVIGAGPLRGHIKTCMEAKGYTKTEELNVPMGQTVPVDIKTQTVLKIR